MQSVAIEIFLSCSFQKNDAVIVDLVRSICRALDLHCTNVSKGYAEIPGKKASQYISELPAMIAIATKRERYAEGDYAMPSAVHEELFMAFGADKPILLIREDGVRVDGFLGNIGTYLTFSRDAIWNPEFIEKLVASIHAFKMHVLPATGLGTYPHSDDYSTETFQALIELERDKQGFTWAGAFTRRIRFLNDFEGPLKARFWPDQMPSENQRVRNVSYKLRYESGSQDFRLQTIKKKNPAALLDLSIHIRPQPQKDDFIQYTVFCKSKHLFPIYLEETSTIVEINNRQYPATAGVIRNTLTETLRLLYTFPKEYGLDSRDITAVAATYSTTIDRIDEGEMERIKPSIESYGGNIIAKLEVDKPVLGRFYGVAWIPPKQRRSK